MPLQSRVCWVVTVTVVLESAFRFSLFLILKIVSLTIWWLCPLRLASWLDYCLGFPKFSMVLDIAWSTTSTTTSSCFNFYLIFLLILLPSNPRMSESEYCSIGPRSISCQLVQIIVPIKHLYFYCCCHGPTIILVTLDWWPALLIIGGLDACYLTVATC